MAPAIPTTVAWNAANAEHRSRWNFINRLLAGKVRKAIPTDKLEKYGITQNADGTYVLPKDWRKAKLPPVVVRLADVETHTAAPPPQRVADQPTQVNIADDTSPDAKITPAMLIAHGRKLLDDGTIKKVGTFNNKWLNCVKILTAAGAVDVDPAKFDMIKFLNHDPEEKITALRAAYPNHFTFSAKVACITTWFVLYNQLAKRIPDEVVKVYNQGRTTAVGHAETRKNEKREGEATFSWPGIMSLVRDKGSSLQRLYLEVFEQAPVRRDLEGMVYYTQDEMTTVHELKPNYMTSTPRGTVIINLHEYKTQETYGQKSYALSAQTSKLVLAELAASKGKYLFPKSTIKSIGDLLRTNGNLFPNGLNITKRADDVAGLRHALSTYRNGPLYHGEDKGIPLAERMLHSNAAVQTSYRYARVLNVAGYDENGNPEGGTSAAPQETTGSASAGTSAGPSSVNWKAVAKTVKQYGSETQILFMRTFEHAPIHLQNVSVYTEEPTRKPKHAYIVFAENAPATVHSISLGKTFTIPTEISKALKKHYNEADITRLFPTTIVSDILDLLGRHGQRVQFLKQLYELLVEYKPSVAEPDATFTFTSNATAPAKRMPPANKKPKRKAPVPAAPPLPVELTRQLRRARRAALRARDPMALDMDVVKKRGADTQDGGTRKK